MKLLFMSFFITFTIALVMAQHLPRINVNGALHFAPSPLLRNDRLPVRVLRPIIRSQSSDTSVAGVASREFDESKPVTESTEEEISDVFVPQILREQKLPKFPQQLSEQPPIYFNEQKYIQQDSSMPEEKTQPTQFIGRPTLLLPASPQPSPQTVKEYGIPRVQSERPRPQLLVNNRPAAQKPHPQLGHPSPKPKPIKSRPIEQNNLNQEDHRPRKPVAQILRKYREEHSDGSITWGYENDDGSFKEEVIGTDCVTKGTYGYIDPEGNKREYHYETGIKCDANNRQPEEQGQRLPQLRTKQGDSSQWP